MGSVFSAEHTALGSRAAVKVIDPELLLKAAHEEATELQVRFLREAQAAASLNSAHVVRVLDYGIERGSPYIAMELLEGETLADFMERQRVLTPAQTLQILSDVAKAVSKGHEAGIIHRDLKPENIFLARVDDAVVAKVLDFGIAKMARSPLNDGTRTTRRGELLGTPCYMSPEQMTGREIDGQADIWALSVIAFECLTGRLPFDAENVGALAVQICTHDRPLPSHFARVPSAFDAWWMRASQRDVAVRFASLRQAIEALRDALGGEARPSLADAAAFGPPMPARAGQSPSLADAATLGPKVTALSIAGQTPRRGQPLALLGAGFTLILLLAGGAWFVATRRVVSPQASPSAVPAMTTSVPAKVSAPTVTPSVASPPTPSAISSTAPSASAMAPAHPPTAPIKRPVAKPTDPRLGI
jgi:serine/threonine-protein kinase